MCRKRGFKEIWGPRKNQWGWNVFDLNLKDKVQVQWFDYNSLEEMKTPGWNVVLLSTVDKSSNYKSNTRIMVVVEVDHRTSLRLRIQSRVWMTYP